MEKVFLEAGKRRNLLDESSYKNILGKIRFASEECYKQHSCHGLIFLSALRTSDEVNECDIGELYWRITQRKQAGDKAITNLELACIFISSVKYVLSIN